jgi:catechol 2,3-dioxygenase
MIRPDRIGHVALQVQDLQRSCAFYRDVLGLQLMKEIPEWRAAFFSSGGRDHHEIALLEVGPRAASPQGHAVKMLHVAFRVRSEAELRAAYQELKARGIPITFTVDHGISKSIYFQDPDGHGIEVYCDNPPEAYAHMPNPYAGVEKLDFAQSDPGLADALALRSGA